MGAMASPPHWVPEDDVLLKNAMEAGASLEYLSKGAVEFSRRFTFTELKERWSSLLYDPVISVEASARMAEVERSSFPNQWRPKLEGGKEFAYSLGKRKAESIRKCYYAMRKRICNEPLDMLDINLLSGPGYSNFGDGNELSSADCRISNPVLNNLGIEGPDFDIRHQFFPESSGNSVAPSFCGQDLHLGGKDVPRNPSYPYEGNISLTEDCSGFNQSKGLPLCNLFEAEGLVNEGSACSEFGGLQFSSFGCSSPPPTWHTSQETPAAVMPIQIGEKDQQTSTEDYLAELSSALFDFADIDPPLSMNNDVKDALEKSYLDGLSSLLLDSPSQSELPIACQGEGTVATDEHLVDTNGVHNGRLNAEEAPSPPPVKGFGPEYRNGVICCTLNTEDSEIPSNDDVFLPFRCPSPTASSGTRWRLQVSSPVKESSSTPKAHGGALSMINGQKDTCAPPQMIGSSQSSDEGLRYPTEDHGIKFELPKSNIEHAALRNARNIECPNRLENVNANNVVGMVNIGSSEMEHGKNMDYKSVGPCHVKHEIGLGIPQSLQKNATNSRSGLGAKAGIPNNGSSNAVVSSQQTVVPKPFDQSLLSGQEELWSENEFDVPYFSDVEAMILDMDLSPDEFDMSTLPEVQQYQHEETKRTIIRLEQSADACTQRTIAGQGAFAVMYGRHSKYFIKKPEVLLGRSTDDIKVDIDLGREKDGGKISRRQAIMKMDMNGIFHLKNLGKTLIYVNGNQVESGESVNLTPRCLIELRELAFVFETNRRMVKQFVDSVGRGGLSGGS
ncbi:hypothetical protein ACS0TY_031408 [Phlomoides rotata]